MARNFILLLTLFLFCRADAQNNATVKEYTKSFTTYPFSEPDPVPNPSSLFYPYFRFDGFALKSENREWKVVQLENDFIRLLVMPQIGGKIWTAIDKKNNKSFIYDNDAVKFRDIAMRGPWTSGGLEANFGIMGHTPGVATPVNYKIYTTPDGSAVCLISLLDLLTQTRWNMEIILPKDKAYFITRFLWHNGTGIEQPYYSWMNLGEKVTDSLEYIFPGNHYLFHDGKVYDWPIDKENGKRISIYNQNDFGSYKSYHVTGTYSKYFGVFWQKENYGMIHFAERQAKIGKKVWIWGLSRQGMIWEKLLTDHSGQYTEIQSGRLYNQNAPESVETPFKQYDFMPYNTDTWDEYWYPYHNTKGVVNADRDGVLNIADSNGKSKIYFSSVGFLNDTLKVWDKSGRLLVNSSFKLKPLENWQQELPVVKNDIGRISWAGKTITINNDASKILDRPVEPFKGFDWNSAYGYYLKGYYQSGTRHYKEAEENIQHSLRMNPSFVPALSEMAFLQYRKMNYDSAYMYAQTGLSVDTYDPKTNYYYGLAALKIGKIFDAKDGFQVAAITPVYRSAAYTELSKIAIREKNFPLAAEYAGKSLINNSKNISALQLLYVALEKSGSIVEADKIKKEILQMDPINHFIRFEEYWQHKTTDSENAFTELIRDELPQETYLDLAIWFADLNLIEESRDVLEICPQKNDEIWYWLAWLSRDTQRSKEFLSQAKNGNPLFVFPFRSESVPVMEWAVATAGNWKAKYYLSTLYSFFENRRRAFNLINAVEAPDNFAPFYVLRARLRDSSDIRGIQDDLTKALTIDKDDWRYAKYLADFYLVHNKTKEALKTIAPYFTENTSNYMAGLLYIRCLLNIEDYSSVEKIMKTIEILPNEGAKDAHAYYQKVKLMMAVKELNRKNYKMALQKVKESQLWPENLGVGAPYPQDIDLTLQNQLSGLISQSKKGIPVNEETLKGIIKRIKAL